MPGPGIQDQVVERIPIQFIGNGSHLVSRSVRRQIDRAIGNRRKPLRKLIVGPAADTQNVAAGIMQFSGKAQSDAG